MLKGRCDCRPDIDNMDVSCGSPTCRAYHIEVKQDLKNWPKDKWGNYLCTKKYPMPKEHSKLGWIHEDAEETDLDSDYRIEYKCPNCNKVFSIEMPD